MIYATLFPPLELTNSCFLLRLLRCTKAFESLLFQAFEWILLRVAKMCIGLYALSCRCNVLSLKKWLVFVKLFLCFGEILRGIALICLKYQ